MADHREQQQEMMKKFLKNFTKIEAVLLCIIVSAIIIRPSELKAGSFMLIISMSILAMIYLYKSFETHEEINHPNEEFVQKLMGMGMTTAVIGILFKLLNWPGNQIMLIVGTFTMPFVVVLAINTILKYKEKAVHTYKSLIRPILIMIIGVVLIFIPWHILRKNKLVFGENVENKEQVDSTKNK